MPISPAAVSHAEISLQGIIAAAGSNSVNTQFVFHYRRQSTAFPLVKSALDTIFQSQVAAKVILALNLRWTQTGNAIRWIDDALDQATFIPHVNVGAVTGDSMPTHVAVEVLLRTGIRGKSYRGSKHFGPLSESDTTTGSDDILNAAAITRFNAIMTAAGTSLNDGGGNLWNLCVYSRKLSQSLINPTNIVTNDVTQLALNKRLGNMRRRQVRSAF